MKDYLVVGLGLAGISFCEQLLKSGRSFVVFENRSQRSSVVAGGLYNPVILKRFTPAWNAKDQLARIDGFYGKLQDKLKAKLDHKLPIYRRLISVEEQNNWFAATDNPILSEFLSPDLIANKNKCLEAQHHFGEVKHTGRVDTKVLLENYRQFLQEKGFLEEKSFTYELLQLDKGPITYGRIQAKRVVFCEGYGLKQNPFFDYLPLNGTKGELLTIKAPKLKLEQVVKSSVFIIPLGNDVYRIGATYKWKDKTNVPTKDAKEELLRKLRSFLSCEFEVIDHVAGIRPTVVDRRPMVGQHPIHEQLYVFNGLGSRGVMIAPTVSEQLFDHIEDGQELDPETDIKRFQQKYFRSS